MKLHNYWRSATSYRARIALNMKGIDYEYIVVNLLDGAHKQPDYTALNPLAAVPTLILDDGTALTQSMAIIEWLEETHPEPALLPRDTLARAKIRAAAGALAVDIHPVVNLKVINRIKDMGHSQDEAVAWMEHWVLEGFKAFDALIDDATPFSFGDTPGLADIYLVAQLYGAHRWEFDLSAFPRLTEIEKRCLDLPAFDKARPENQPEATK